MKNKIFGTSEKNIEVAIKSWLRHARERIVKTGVPSGGNQENSL